MNRSDVSELHYITPVASVPSILEHGILSHHRAASVPHQSLAMQEIQERRQLKGVPGGRPLHEYVNLYFDAHNPMLSKCRHQNDNICVLRVAVVVLDIPDVIVTDGNAASDYARFYPAREGIRALDKTMVYATFWVNPGQDNYETIRRKSAKCAEVLVPDRVDAGLIIGAYVANDRALVAIKALQLSLLVVTKPAIFFSTK